MRLKWPTSIFEMFNKLVPRLSSYREKMYTFLDPPCRITTEHSWTKTILSRGGRRKLFNPDLMNKLIRME